VRITPHGFRAAFRSWAGDTGQPRELAEHALAHAMGDATERAYARSDLLARRSRLMVVWADHCEGWAKDDALAAAPVVRAVAS
jgi:integrase